MEDPLADGSMHLDLNLVKREDENEEDKFQMNNSTGDNDQLIMDLDKEERELLDKLKKEDMQEEINVITSGNIFEDIDHKKEENDPLSAQQSYSKQDISVNNLEDIDQEKEEIDPLSYPKREQEKTTEESAGVFAVPLVPLSKAIPQKSYKKEETQEDPPKEETWYTVGYINGNNFNVQNYFLADHDTSTLTSDNLPDCSAFSRISLEPGTAYKFRVAAINSCGRGEWSGISAYKTSLPGYPGAPSCIQIAKLPIGAKLSWDPPQHLQGDIIEYSVYLAVRCTKVENKNQGKLAFVRVYSGPNNTCVVTNLSLSAAFIDTTTKPAIIFRIAAKNEKGYGPATQVRWLQEATSAGKALKRVIEGNVGDVKKCKTD